MTHLVLRSFGEQIGKVTRRHDIVFSLADKSIRGRGPNRRLNFDVATEVIYS